MRQDIVSALRSFRQAPVFTAVAIVSLTLAIGANTAILGLLNALVLRELPVRDPQQLVQVSSIAPNATYEAGVTFAMYREFLRRQQVFASVIGWSSDGVRGITLDRDQTHGAITLASGNFHAELGIAALHGRMLDAGDVGDSTLTPSRVAVIGYTFWQQHFGGDPAAIGRTVRVEDEPFTIVGIAPQGFTGLGLTIEPDVTLPLTASPIINHTPIVGLATSASSFVRMTGRLKPGVSVEQARAAIEAMWPALKADMVPSTYASRQRDRFLGSRVVVASIATGYEPQLRARFTRPLAIVLGIALLVLVIACVNLASLMLARASARMHDVGVRLALGASRWRIARSLIVEGLLLAAIGAACGSWFAYASSYALMRQIFAEYVIPASLNVAPDARLLALTALLACLAGMLFSVVPAWRAARQDSSRLLQQGGGRTIGGTGRTGRVLVGVQIALSLMLLTNAGLLVRTLQEIRAVHSGMRAEDVFVAYPGPRAGGGYAGVDNDTYYPRVIERLQAIPGVSRVAISLFKPAGGGVGGGERISPIASAADSAATMSLFTSISPGFFQVLGIGVTGGRDFSWDDNSRGRRVAIISDTLARQMFPRGDAVGQHVRVGVLPRRQDLEVVGVVADAHVYDLKDSNVSAIYVPALQEPESVNYKCFVIRTHAGAADGAGAAGGARGSLAAINAVLDGFGYERASNAQTLAYITDRALLQERITAALAAFFGGLALLLGAIGLYGLMSYDVTRRRREIGIRVALGAVPAGIVRAILREGLVVAVTGVAVGSIGSLVSSRLVASLLFGVTTRDPMTFAGAAVVLVAVAIVACVLPARRASRIEPTIALRAE
jgi:putative ABC transport system permease protein